MHIKRMHEMIEKLTECTKMAIENDHTSVGAYPISDVMDMIKDLAEAEYHSRISKAMEEAEKEDEEEAKYIMKKMKEEYGDEEGERRFYDNYRYKSSGRFAPKGRGSYMPIRGYDETPYMMMPQVHNPMEWDRDMDRMNGRMYYPNGSNANGDMNGNMGGNTRGYSDGYSDGLRDGSRNNQRDSREGRSGRSRRGYVENKEMHKGNTEEDKNAKMKSLEEYMKDLSADITELIGDMDNSEKTMLRSKLQTLTQKIV